MTGTKLTPISREDLKQMHQKQIFLLARGGSRSHANFPGISRAELKAQLGLSFPSITALVDELLEKGVLEETGTLEACERGRPRKLLRVRPSLFYVPTFELISDGFHFCLYDACGSVALEEFYPFPSQQLSESKPWKPTMELFCAPFLQSIASLNHQYPLTDLLLSLPGTIRENGEFHSSSIGIVSPPDFLSYIREHTGLSVRTINRSDSLAYAELLYEPSLSDYVYVYISDGVGAGIIRDKQIFSCGPWRAGEIGHMSVDYRGRPCSCGSRGCLERYLCSSAIAEDCSRLSEAELDFDDVCQAYLDGAEPVEEFLKQRAELLCVTLNSAFSMHPVTHVIVGGSVTKLGEKYRACLEETLETTVSNIYRGKTKLTFSKSDGSDSTFGAYHNYVTNVLRLEQVLILCQ